MVASPGGSDYSRLSVGVYFKALCSIVEAIPPNCFHPRPIVDSAMVELIPRDRPPFTVEDEDFFFEVVRLLFNHRRKKIRTILSKQYRISTDEILFGDSRVETLSPEQIGMISDSVYRLIH